MAKGKTKREMNFQKKVKAIVNEELQEELEDKVAVIGSSNASVQSPSIPAGNVLANPNFIQLFPSISQGLKQYNQRVGNEIRLQSIDLKMLLQYVRPFDTLDYTDTTIGVRVMILKQKDNNDFRNALQNFQGDKLLENGNITTPGPADFNGRTINLFQKINREQFAVRYDKTFYMERPLQTVPLPGPAPGTSGTTTVVYNRPPRPTMVQKKITFGKNGLKLTYGDGASTYPTQFPYFLCIGYASIISTAAPSNDLIQYSYTSNCAYTDA